MTVAMLAIIAIAATAFFVLETLASQNSGDGAGIGEGTPDDGGTGSGSIDGSPDTTAPAPPDVPQQTVAPDTIALLAQQAGFSGEDLVTAVAVALAESGGSPVAYNPETAAHTPAGKGSFGLWQIYLNAHPEFSGWNLYDPATNARAAFSVYSKAGDSFSPWSTYKYGQYLAFVDNAQARVDTLAA
jgi:hypothetical protein